METPCGVKTRVIKSFDKTVLLGKFLRQNSMQFKNNFPVICFRDIDVIFLFLIDITLILYIFETNFKNLF